MLLHCFTVSLLILVHSVSFLCCVVQILNVALRGWNRLRVHFNLIESSNDFMIRDIDTIDTLLSTAPNQQYFRLHCSVIQQHEQWLGITEIRNWRFKCQFIMKASIRYMICVDVPANVKTKSHRIWTFPIVFRFHWNYMVRHRMAWNENKTFSGEFAFQLKAWYGWRQASVYYENWKLTWMHTMHRSFTTELE